MAITLGEVTFDEAHTTVKEEIAEVGGRDERIITVSGLVLDQRSPGALDAALDDIAAACSTVDYTAFLSVRAGRRFRVRRNEFKREVDRNALVGAFTLVVAAGDPREESVDETRVDWEPEASGAAREFMTQGNTDTGVTLTLTAAGDVATPAFSDGTRTITYDGIVPDAGELVIDGEARTATLNGEDVTPYTAGLFPRIAPGGTTLIYTANPSGGQAARIAVAYRDRWW